MFRIIRPSVGLAALVLAARTGLEGQTRPSIAARYDDHRPRHDARHYDVQLELADSGTSFRAAVTTHWQLENRQPIRIDLDGGYRIDSLTVDGRQARYIRSGDSVLVSLPAAARGRAVSRIVYSGSPPKFRNTGQDDGLVQRGSGASRTIFADNWPDRARKWLAAQDHPSDKATVAWTIVAPLGLTVVANGRLEGVDTVERRARWRFRIEQPIPVYTMVVGAARLAVTELRPAACKIRCVPVSVITYPEDSAWAVEQPFKRASEMVDFYSELIAPFPYGELRHVQTSTIFGGMENSTVIFYDEKSYRARTLGELTVAHETIHQWFGDAATERDWHHLWLSEGFATYGAVLWSEKQGGDSALKAGMQAHKRTVMADSVTDRPIIDPDAKDLLKLLNSNNYPKGAWVLHTLRGMVGDSVFFRGIRNYYRAHEHGTALSADFARVMSREAGQDLTWYFRQALTQPGYPILRVETRIQGGHLSIDLRQVQKPAWGLFRLPNLTIRLGGRTIAVPMMGPNARTVAHWERTEPPTVEVDPDGWWLVDVVGAD